MKKVLLPRGQVLLNIGPHLDSKNEKYLKKYNNLRKHSKLPGMNKFNKHYKTGLLCFFSEIDDWSKYPIGVLPNQNVTYRNLELFRDEDGIEDVAMETEECEEATDDTEDSTEDIDENVDAG